LRAAPKTAEESVQAPYNASESALGAETYSSAIADARNYMDWLVGTFRPYLRGRILEVGIGHGHYSTRFAKFGSYLGIDVSEASVTLATSAFRLPPSAFREMQFARCDILDRAQLRGLLPDGANAIVSINVLEHIEDDATAIANLVDTLKPGGHLRRAAEADHGWGLTAIIGGA